MKMSTAAQGLARRGFVNVNRGGSIPVYTKVRQRGGWMCGLAVALTPRGAIKFRQKVCMRDAEREVAGELSYMLEESAGVGGDWDDVAVGRHRNEVGLTLYQGHSHPVSTYDPMVMPTNSGEYELISGDEDLEDTAVIAEGWWDDEVGGRGDRRRRRGRRKARRRARRARRRARAKALRKKVRAALHKVSKKLAKSKVLKGLRKGWSKLLQTPLAQKAIQAGAKALGAFGIPPAATRAVLTQMKNNAIARMEKGGLPAMLARATHKDAKRGAFFKEFFRRQGKILPSSLAAMIPGGGGGNLQAAFKKMAPKQLVSLAKNLGGGKLSAKQIGKLAKSLRSGKVGLRQLQALKKLRHTKASKLKVAKVLAKRKRRRSRSPSSNVRRDVLKRYLKSKRGQKVLRRCLNPRGKMRGALSQAHPKVRVSGEEFLGNPSYKDAYRF